MIFLEEILYKNAMQADNVRFLLPENIF